MLYLNTLFPEATEKSKKLALNCISLRGNVKSKEGLHLFFSKWSLYIIAKQGVIWCIST